MPLIDSRGRLFGRLNLIDAALLGAAGVVIVLGYGAYLLFRLPDPVVTSVTPADIVSGQEGTLHVTGQDLRPFLTARLECSPRSPSCESMSLPLLVANPTRAAAPVRNLMPGSYDFVLLDEAREVARMAAAIRVLSAAASTPTMELQAAGAFVFLTESAASMIVSGALLEEAFPRGYTFIAGEGLDGPAGTIVKTLPAEAGALRLRIAAGDPAAATMVLPDTRQVPAILQLRCTFFADRCRISGTDILKDAVVPLALSIPKDQKFTRPITRVAFRIDEVRPVGAPHEFPPPPPASPPPVLATVRVKILARTEIAGLPRVGDEDFSVPAPADSAVQSLSLHARAKVISVDTVPREVATTVRTAEFDFQETMTTFEATFAVPVDQTPAGWQYAGRAIKVGAPFRFEGRTYGINGWIVDVRIGRSLPAAATQ